MICSTLVNTHTHRERQTDRQTDGVLPAILLAQPAELKIAHRRTANTEYKVKKGKSEHLYSALYGIQTTLKRSDMDHTVLPAINTMPAVYLVSVHQMAPPPIEAANI